jgi:hypothetical protein
LGTGELSIDSLIMQAKKKNADGIVAMRFTTSPVMRGQAATEKILIGETGSRRCLPEPVWRRPLPEMPGVMKE